jgi:spermidine synthase
MTQSIPSPAVALASHRPSRGQDMIAWGALFASGAAALIYEVCWIRQASLVFGSGTFALSSVLAVFFLGLALGSYGFGRLAQRVSRPLIWFAALELGVGLYALASPLVFQGADYFYGLIYRAAPEQPVLLGVARAALVGLSIIPATTLMGGTLPLFCRRYAAARQPVTRSVGLLYGLNTLGAAAGAAAAGFLLLPALGLGQSLLTGVALSLASGLVAAALPGSRVAQPLPASAALPAGTGAGRGCGCSSAWGSSRWAWRWCGSASCPW